MRKMNGFCWHYEKVRSVRLVYRDCTIPRIGSNPCHSHSNAAQRNINEVTVFILCVKTWNVASLNLHGPINVFD